MSKDIRVANVALIIFGVAFALGMIVLDYYDLPPVTWVNDWQKSYFGGRYYPKLSALILLVLVGLPCYGVYTLTRAIQETSGGRRQGRLYRDDEDDDRPRLRKGRRREDEVDEAPSSRRCRRDDDEGDLPRRRRPRREDGV